MIATPPDVVSRLLELDPSSTQTKGATWIRRGEERTYPLSGWFLTSEDKLPSCDSARHLLWLLERIRNKKSALENLRASGWRMDISCFWDSSWGHGGPTISPQISKQLGELEIELWFDVYFTGAMGWNRAEKQACAIKAPTE